mgnify:CR=1 FL=1
MTWLYAVQFAVPLLGHLQPGSVRVHAGADVAVGEWIGSVGNSGNTGEPHLHIHAQGRGTIEAPLGGDPRPIQFNGRFPVRGDRIEAPWGRKQAGFSLSLWRWPWRAQRCS